MLKALSSRLPTILFITLVIVGSLRPVMNFSIIKFLGPAIYLVPDARVFSDSYFFTKTQISLIDIESNKSTFLLDYKTAKNLVFADHYPHYKIRLINFSVTRPHLLGQYLLNNIIKQTLCKDLELTRYFKIKYLKTVEIQYLESQKFGLPEAPFVVECVE